MMTWFRKIVDAVNRERNEAEDALERRIIRRMKEPVRPDLERLAASEIINLVRRHDQKRKWYRL